MRWICLSLLFVAGCSSYTPVVSDIAAGMVRGIEWNHPKPPTTRPWHFEEFDHDGIHDARVVFDDGK